MELVDQSARKLVSNEEEEIPKETKKDQVCCNHDFMDQQEERRGESLRIVRNKGQDEIDPLIPTLVFDVKINCRPIYFYPTFGKRKVILEDLYVGPSDQVWKYKSFALKLGQGKGLQKKKVGICPFCATDAKLVKHAKCAKIEEEDSEESYFRSQLILSKDTDSIAENLKILTPYYLRYVSKDREIRTYLDLFPDFYGSAGETLLYCKIAEEVLLNQGTNVGKKENGKDIENDELPFISQSVNVKTRKRRADRFPELNLTKKHRGIHEALMELRSESFPEDEMDHDLPSDQDGDDDDKEEVDIKLSQEGDFAAHFCSEKHYSPEEKEYAENVSENLIPEKLLDEIIGLIHASAHRSVAGTLRQLKSLNLTFHPNLGERVEKLISNCRSCRFGKLKGDMKSVGKLPVGDAPFQVIAADIFHFRVSEKAICWLNHSRSFYQIYSDLFVKEKNKRRISFMFSTMDRKLWLFSDYTHRQHQRIHGATIQRICERNACRTFTSRGSQKQSERNSGT